MIPANILEKVRRIHITTTRLAENVFAGEYKSVFKGRGLEFHEVREYQVGDEVRQIDWNVTARAGKPFIKKFIEERELTIVILLDASKSTYFGSRHSLKIELAAEVAAVLASSANSNNDKVGLMIFSDRIEKFIRPRKGKHHMQRIIREILCQEPKGEGTDIPLCLRRLDRVTKHGAVVFLISDFYADGLEKPVTIANKKHDLIAVRILDPMDRELPDAGLVSLFDAESGRRYCVDTGRKDVRDAYRAESARRCERAGRVLSSCGVDTIDIATGAPYTEALSRFFANRKLRRRGSK